MKYKVGDKVKIKIESFLSKVVKQEVRKLPEFIVTIKKIVPASSSFPDKEYYIMEELSPNFWYDEDVEELVEKYIVPIPILTRWEILDL